MNVPRRQHRHFPPPWTVEESEKTSRACFIVRDHNGQQLAYVYFEDEPGRRTAAKPLTRDEARRIAANTPKLPELVRSPSPEHRDQRNYLSAYAMPFAATMHWPTCPTSVSKSNPLNIRRAAG